LGENLGGVYPTITSALSDLNNLGILGPVRFLLVDASYPTETYPLTINVVAADAPNATNTVEIKPGVGVSPTVSGAFAGPIFRIVNTNYVTIDGSNTIAGTTRDLTIMNTGTTSPNVVHVGSFGTTPVTNATVRNCILVNGAQTSSAIVVSDGNAVGSPGYFSDIMIQNNSIQRAYIGVYTNGGTSPQQGSDVSYIDNSLNASGTTAIRYIGLYIQGVDGATISGNTIGNFEDLSGEDDRGIWMASGTINATASGNEIFGLNYGGTAGWGAHGIDVSSSQTGSNNLVKNNMIYDLSGMAGITHQSSPTIRLASISSVHKPE